MTRAEYRSICEQKVKLLTEDLGLKPIKHGQSGICPRCGRVGKFDFDIGYSFPNTNAIYWSTVHDAWFCEECEMLEAALGTEGRILLEQLGL